MSHVTEFNEEKVDELEEISDSTLIYNEFKNNRSLSVKIENSTNTRSLARQYFGVLKDDEKNMVVDKFHVYCKVCFMHPDGRKIHRYKSTVSTGNLLLHLNEIHGIKPMNSSNERSNIRRFFQFSHGQPQQLPNSSQITKKKKELSDSITLWFCRDLIPFHETEKEGLKDFLKFHNVIQSLSDVPCSSTLSRSSLTRIYEDCLFAVK